MKRKLANHVKQVKATDKKRSVVDRALILTYDKYRTWKRKLKGHDSPSYNRLYLKSRHLKRNLDGRQFSFVSIDQASLWTNEWVKTFPEQYDLIVGIPRSGMMVATIIALKTGRALTTPELFSKGEFWYSSHVKDKLAWDEVKNVLLVDDSVDTGKSMSSAVDVIESAGHSARVTKAALIVHKKSLSNVGLYHKVVSNPRAFEWNILHRKLASYWGHGMLAVDMDGVLCSDCPPGVDDDEERYVKWINSANPYLIPVFEIDFIVTNRLEKYRDVTERWLRDHNVKYRELHMWNIGDKSDRKGEFAQHKIEKLLQLKPDMYWESNWSQSRAIWAETKIPTLCIDEMTLLS